MIYDKSKTVIVYLAMNTEKDETYGRDSRSMLEKSLDLLYINYNAVYKHDIIIFYDDKYPFLEEDQINIRKDRNEIKFINIPKELWCPPASSMEIIKNPDIKNWCCPNMPIGYRNMIRWFGIHIYTFLHNLGYEWYLRLDDDSFIYSEINYDLFKFMIENNYLYGFRVYSNDNICVSNGLIEFCKMYCDNNNIGLGFMSKYSYENNSYNTSKYNILGYYNNFHITAVSFWIQPKVQRFLNAIDQSGYMYTRRWGDLLSQSASVQIFMDRNKLYHFNDWTYEHATFSRYYTNKNQLNHGGLYPKISDYENTQSEYAIDWQNKYLVYHRHSFDTLDIKNCLTSIPLDMLYFVLNHNTNFKIFNNNDVYYLGECDSIESVYYTIEDHLMNCEDKLIRDMQFKYPVPIAFTWYKSVEHGFFNKKLYAINNCSIVKVNYDMTTTSFIMFKRFII